MHLSSWCWAKLVLNFFGITYLYLSSNNGDPPAGVFCHVRIVRIKLVDYIGTDPASMKEQCNIYKGLGYSELEKLRVRGVFSNVSYLVGCKYD